MAKRSFLDVLKRHEYVINTMMYVLSDHTQGLMEVMPRCTCQKHLVTMVNVLTGEFRCDRCCAELVVDASKLAVVLQADVERSERNWTEVTFAEASRRIENHNDHITHDFEEFH